MRIVQATALLFVAICQLQSAFAESRVALVIGNGSYEKVPELPNPPRDAVEIGRALARLNFKVSQINNATAQDMRKALIDFGRVAEGADMAVVFYAGHGMEVAGENWLIPIGAELRSDADIENEAISLRSISGQVSKAKQLGLVILDACRNNPFAAKMKRSISTRAVVRGLAPTEPSDNVLIAYAARDGTTASDGDDRHSPFTKALLRHIETPGLEIAFLFRRVRDDVMTATKREQQPFVYGSLSKEEIYLKLPSASPAASSAPRPLAAIVTEVATAAPTAVSPKPETSGNQNAAAKPPDRNVFAAEDGQKIAAIAAAQNLSMPTYSFVAAPDDPLHAQSRLIGVWSNDRGWGDGSGRYGMLIVTEVSTTGLARGFYLWGPPGRRSWTKDPAGYKSFSDYIVNGKLSIGGTEVSAKLDNRNVLTLSSFRKGKPSDTSSMQMRPVWQLVRARTDSGPTAKREQNLRREPTKAAASSETRPARAAGGSTIEERYRACSKLVKGYNRREACARTGAI